MKTYGIGPHTILQPGTRVKVKGLLGVVESHEKAPNGVVVHTVRITHKFERGFGSQGTWRKHEAKPFKPNYSFVEVIEGE